MARLIWSPQAVDDLEDIVHFIARDSYTYARLTARRILDAVKRLELFPESGRVIPEIQQETAREIFVGTYRVLYRIKGDEVHITAIIHGARYR